MTLNPSQILNNRYRIVKLLGQGGFGAVYRAWDTVLERPCALKESIDTSPEAQRQFLREARLLANLKHPNLPGVSDHFTIPDQGQYLVMDFVEGEDLQAMLERKGEPLPEAEVLPWILQVCDALAYLHAQNPPIIHRDVKPANIKITPQGQAMLVFFGIAKIFNPHLKTTVGARAVTPGFSPPEQYGQGATDARSDVYSLGATLYAVLTGREPVESVQRTVGASLTSPRSLNPAISPSVESAIMRAMELLPDHRFRSAAEFKVALLPSEADVFAVPEMTQISASESKPTEKVDDAVLLASTPQSPARVASAQQAEPAKLSSSWRVWGALFGILMVIICAVTVAYPLINGSPIKATPTVTTPSQAQVLKPTITHTVKPNPSPSSHPTDRPTVPPPPVVSFKACQVTDVGGIDDRSFNATAWKGVQDAIDQLGIEGKYLESQQQTDYEKNINAFIEEGCNIIITVGFLLGDATQAAAEQNPDQKFSIVDLAYDPTIPNVLGQVFKTDEAAFLAGYVAAGVSKSGKIGTFGGIQLPPVTLFMDGFYAGAMYYNAQHGTDVQVLGWDPVAQTGLFTGNFESADDGRTTGLSLMDEGADIIMPVAGPVGLGAAAAAKERGGVYIVGVDNDWFLAVPEYRDIILTSVLKNMDITTLNAIQSAMGVGGTFAGGVMIGNLENGGVGLAPYHDLAWLVPATLQTELVQLRVDIISGKVDPSP